MACDMLHRLEHDYYSAVWLDDAVAAARGIASYYRRRGWHNLAEEWQEQINYLLNHWTPLPPESLSSASAPR